MKRTLIVILLVPALLYAARVVGDLVIDGTLTLAEQSAPGAGAASGQHNVYVDSADGRLKSHENGGSAVTYKLTSDTDDDVPESGDFGAAVALEADGSLSDDVVDSGEIVDGSVDVEHVENDLKTYHDCQTLVDFGTAIPDTADIPSLWGEFPFAMTLTKVWCETDANTATISLQRDDGTPASMLSANLVCDTNEQDSCASGCDVNTIDGAEDDVAVGQQIDFVIVSIGTVNRINICVTGIIQ